MSRVLVTGGARSGKSAFAESYVRHSSHVLYVAPGSEHDPSDSEWNDRIALHRARRPTTWTTLESTDLASILRANEGVQGVVLVDCLGIWLAGAMDEAGIWAESDGSAGPDADGALGRSAGDRLTARIEELLAAWRSCVLDVVVVTNEVGSSIVPATLSGRRFRDELGRLNVAMASGADEVWLVTVGIPQRLR